MLLELNKISQNGLDIDNDIELNKELYKNAPILDLLNMHIIGNIKYDYENNLVFNLEVKGDFLLEDALTSEPIKYPFTCEIAEVIDNLEERGANFYEKSKNTLDISEILWENIVLEIPISATLASDTPNLKGSGWELCKEKKEEIDPRLAKLTELFSEGKE